MNTRRLVTLLALLVVVFLAQTGFARADGGATDGVGTEKVNATVDLANKGVAWGGSSFNTWYVYAKNYGSGNAGGFWARVTKTNGTLIKWVWVPGLSAGQTATISFTTTDKCVYVMLDYFHVVPETNELNNFIAPCSPFK